MDPRQRGRPSSSLIRRKSRTPCSPKRREPTARLPPTASHPDRPDGASGSPPCRVPRLAKERRMFENYYRKDIAWGGQLLTLETGKIARQADGAVMARLGDTIVLCTVVGARSARPGQDFFPLTVKIGRASCRERV